MNVLVVDDVPANRRLLRAVLEAEGLHVRDAADGVEALATLQREPVDAVISDILMPRMDGYRLCFELRASETLRHLPFIVHTATYVSPADEKLALELGADRFLRKPAGARELIAALHDAVGATTARARQRAPSPATAEAAAATEPALMREYNERLVAKLEHKNEELECAREELHRANASLEQRIAARTAELAAVNRQLETFAYAVSHELRTPLRAIDGYGHLLQSRFAPELPEEARRLVGVINESADRMGRLIEDLLNFCRLGRQPLEKRDVPLHDVAQAALDDLRRAGALDGAVITLGPLPRCHADAALVRQVLLNLLTNALKFSRPRRPARIEIGGGEHDGWPVCWVRDNGVGFDPGHAGALFQMFRRLHRQDEFEGTGVGLGIVRDIVQRHGGRVWARGAPDDGATFFFTLEPAAAPAPRLGPPP